MSDSSALTHENFDGITGALTGNGTLATTLGPAGYHSPIDANPCIAHSTQQFVMAGRRKRTVGWPLLNLGSLQRALSFGGQPASEASFRQTIDWSKGTVDSVINHGVAEERNHSCVLLHRNTFVVQGEIASNSASSQDVVLVINFCLGSNMNSSHAEAIERGAIVRWSADELPGEVRLTFASDDEKANFEIKVTDQGLVGAALKKQVSPGETLAYVVSVQFSDLMEYQEPISASQIEHELALHEAEWRRYWDVSSVSTGDDSVDRFRQSALYTIRCQATPWSVPPTLSERYWGAGAFHDEMYPALGLLSAGHTRLAERIPMSRRATLQKALERGKGQGAIYPWSSTEEGDERDPVGPWFTERFHLAQIALTAWSVYLETRDLGFLQDVYPMLKEIANTVDRTIIQRTDQGNIELASCVDFDESAGVVKHGPFTVAGCASALRIAGNAANELGLDGHRAKRWHRIAEEVRNLLPKVDGRYATPEGAPDHASAMGAVWPFQLDLESTLARATARHVQETFKSSKGWRPGDHEVFQGTSWMWAAGHLSAVQAWLGDGERAWEAIREGVRSIGPLDSPNEHQNKEGNPQVPWFTTGCGAWLYGLHSILIQMDDSGPLLLPAVPITVPRMEFSGLSAGRGVCIFGALTHGVAESLSVRSPVKIDWQARISIWAVDASRLIVPHTVEGNWLKIHMSLQPGIVARIVAPG